MKPKKAAKSEINLESLQDALKEIEDNKKSETALTKFKDVEVVREGNQITLPDGMSFDQGIKWLQERKKEEETVIEVNEVITGFPIDCAYALQLVVQEKYGFKKLEGSFFSGPSFRSVPINHKGDTQEVYTGEFSVPGVEAQISIYPAGNLSMVISSTCRKKHAPEIKELARLTRKKLKTHSFYKGKAIRLDYSVSFFGGETVVPSFLAPIPKGTELILNENVQGLISSSIWAPIRYTDQVRKLGKNSLKSSICLEGMYGTGKTLTMAKTAEICEQNGWTYLYLTDPKYLASAYELANTWAPCVLACEDFDTLVKGDNNALQNVMDGITSKNIEVMLLVTTNHFDQIPPVFCRRFNTFIPYSSPDAITASRLVRYYAGADLNESEDLTSVGIALQGYIPSAIAAVVSQAQLYSLDRTKGASSHITAEDLLHAAEGKQAQMVAINREKPKAKSAMEMFGQAFGEAVTWGVSTVSTDQGFVPLSERNSPSKNLMAKIGSKVIEPKYVLGNGQA